jgi:hypothetical protein
MIFSLLWTRVQDAEAKQGLEHGINAFKRALEQGLQRSNGQFLYMLSQLDPRYDRPGDPPYVQSNLIPEIEDVYTVLSTFRLIVANRVARDPVVEEACIRALNYFWGVQGAGTAYTYRSYLVKTYGIAAGEVDLRYAFSLPRFLKDPDNWTSIYRGLSAWVAPYQQKGLLVDLPGQPAGVESVFLSRSDQAFTFALVNVGLPRAALPVSVELDERTAGSQAELVDPADSRRLAELTSHEDDGKLEFEVPSLKEGSVAVVRLTRSGAE